MSKLMNNDQWMQAHNQLSMLAPVMSNDEFAKISRLILDNIAEAVIVAEPNGKIVLFNSAALDIFGATTDMLTKSAAKYRLYLPDKTTLVPPGQLPIERALKGELVEDADVFQLCADGTSRWLRARAFPIVNDRGDQLGAALMCRNRSAEVLLEEQRLQQKSQEKMQLLAEAIPNVSWIADVNGVFSYFNKKWTDLTGLSLDQTNNDGWHKVVHEKDLKITIEHWESARATGEDYELEHRFYTTRGERWQLTRALPVKGPDGNVIWWFGTCTDIDDQKRVNERLEQTIVDLESRTNEAQNARNELKSLAHNVSYELQSQLRGIASSLRLLSTRYKGKMGADADSFISQALAGNKAAVRSLNGLSIYAQTERNLVLRQAFKMNEVADRAQLNVQDLIDERQAIITIDVLPEASGDASLVEYVFQQLLENAITFCNGIPRVRCSATRRDGVWVFSVEDNGIGFEMMDADRIFSMFFRLDKSRPGTGMGLSICRSIVESHGGRMWANSVPKRGTVMYFTLD